MTVRMQVRNVDLTDIVHDYLKEYLITPLPKEKLDQTLQLLISEIRQSGFIQERITLGDEFYWDTLREQLIYKDQIITLTKKERELVKLFMNDIQRDFPYSMILIRLWGETSPIKQDSLKTLIKQLRKKLPVNIIKNIFGYGYTIDLSHIN